MSRIQVAVGVIQQGDYVLIGQRLVKDQYFGKWEFPGGKINSDESPLAALKRELSEELGIEVQSTRPLIYLEHDYPDRHVSLHVFWVDRFSGEQRFSEHFFSEQRFSEQRFSEKLEGAEGQALKWVKPLDCKKMDFLQANDAIINAVSLPKQIWITDIQRFGLEQTVSVIEKAVSQNAAQNLTHNDSCPNKTFAIQLRENDASESQLASYLRKLRKVCDDQLIFLNGSPELAEHLGFDGVQLNSHRAKEYENRQQLPDFWVAVSCHDAQQLQHAEHIADFALLSPIQPTKSHPDQKGIGWQQFESLVKTVKLPCYGLGGMKKTDIGVACVHGGQGIAAISSVWGC